MKPERNKMIWLLLPCLLMACSREEEERPASGYTDIRFTVSAAKTVRTKAVATTSDDGSALTEGGRVGVYVWQGTVPAAENKPGYSNNYIFQTAGTSGDWELSASGGQMQLPTANGYAFYALSTNHADQPVPALETGSRTVTLRNGVDYLLAVSTGNNISGSEPITVPLQFRHIATRVVLTIEPAVSEGYKTAAGLSVAIAPVDSTGSYIDLAASWDASSPKDMIYWGSNSVTGGVPLDQPTGQQKEADKTGGDSGNQFTVSFIILPVAGDQNIPLQFVFTDIEFVTGGVQTKKTYTAMLKVSTEGLKGGYTYGFTAIISRYATKFNALPEVNPWVVDGIGLDEVIEVDPAPGN